MIMTTQNKSREMTKTALFAAIIVLLNFTPFGYIQLPLIKATIIHVPVIIGSILLGPKVGAGLGFVFGLTSLYNNTFTPTLLSFAFSPAIPVPGTDGGNWAALLVAFLPRILVGVFPYYAYKLFDRILKERGRLVSLALSGIVGSMTNTILVLHLIYFLFKDAYGGAFNLAADAVYKTIIGIIIANGIPEAIVAAVITAAVCRAVQSYEKHL
jgi:uncharacterized membrane protein